MGSSGSVSKVYRKQGTFRGHIGKVYCVCISPDEKLCASGAWDERVRLRERQSTKVRVLQHTGIIRAVSFSRCGKFLFVGIQKENRNNSDATVIVWRVSTAKRIREIKHKDMGSGVECLAVSQKGGHLFCGYDHGIAKWHWASGRRVVATKKGECGGISSLAVSLCDAFVISAQGSFVRVWKADDMMCVRKLYSSSVGSKSLDFKLNLRINAIALIPPGEVLAVADTDSTIWLVKWRSGEEVGVLKETASVECLAVSPSGKYLMAGAYNGSISVWEVPKRALRQRFGAHGEAPMYAHTAVSALAVSPCGGSYMLSAGCDEAVVEWKGTHTYTTSLVTAMISLISRYCYCYYCYCYCYYCCTRSVYSSSK